MSITKVVTVTAPMILMININYKWMKISLNRYHQTVDDPQFRNVLTIDGVTFDLPLKLKTVM